VKRSAEAECDGLAATITVSWDAGNEIARAALAVCWRADAVAQPADQG
jgi:hypothetical protein